MPPDAYGMVSGDEARRLMYSSTGAPLSAFSSCLVLKVYLFNHDAFVGSLAHVVDGERGNAAGGHGFHFDAGFISRAAGGANVDGMGVVVQGELHTDKGQGQAMAKR